MAIKRPKSTTTVPNPLHKYASYTYSWSLWWLDVADYNLLMDLNNAVDALNFKPGPKSFVVAEDGGIYPDQRQPGTRGLNYHIQDVQFETVIAPNKTTRSSNMIEGTMTILEPYGVSLIDSLIAASYEPKGSMDGKYYNYTNQPYMLQLEFKGYDESGNEIPGAKEITTYRKRFPIRLLQVKVDISNKGTEYKITFRPRSHASAYGAQNSINQTPQDFTITAGTVEEFFNGPTGLVSQYTAFFNTQIDKQGGGAICSDAVRFNIDDEIGKSKIVNENKVSLPKSNSKTDKIDLKNSTFTIPRGTPLLDIIDKVMSHSDYLIKLQLGLEEFANFTDISDTNVFNSFKTTVNEQIAGVDKAGNPHDAHFNPFLGRRTTIVTFNISQYTTWAAVHPATYRTMMSSSRPYTQKYYDYFYTGNNTDIIEFKLNFDTTYFKSIINFAQVKAADNSSEDTKIERTQLIRPAIALTPSIFTALTPQLGQVPNSTPMTYKYVVGDVNITSGMNIMDRPAAQITADVLQSIYTAQQHDMANAYITIVGDPTLIKQSDWLYAPHPNSIPDISASEYAATYGNLPTDRGDVIIQLTVNTPIDMDTDPEYGGVQGLAYPEPRYSVSTFSGRYRILNIKNIFANGVFTQKLEIAKLINDAYSSAADGEIVKNNGRDDGSDSVITGQNIDKVLTPTNPSLPLSELDDGVDLLPNTNVQPGQYIVNPSSTTPWTSTQSDDPRQ